MSNPSPPKAVNSFSSDPDFKAMHDRLIQDMRILHDNPDIPAANRSMVRAWINNLTLAEAWAKAPIRIGFVAQVGRGKSTLVSLASNLHLDVGPDPQQWSVLPVGYGRTTLGEVCVRAAERTNIALRVEPVPESEVMTELQNLAIDTWNRVHNMDSAMGADLEGAGEEMYGLLRKWIAPDEVTHAKEIDQAALDAESPIRLMDRWKSSVRRSNGFTPFERNYSADESGHRALQRDLQDLMAGRLEGAPAPRQTVIQVPRHYLPEGVDELIDTQGLESDTTEFRIQARADLQSMADDPNTALVICSEFNGAPDHVTKQVLLWAKGKAPTDPAFSGPIRVLLVDTRHQTVGTRAEAERTTKSRQCADRLRRADLNSVVAEDQIISLDARREKDNLKRLLTALAREVGNRRFDEWVSVYEAAEGARAPLADFEQSARLRELDLRIRWAWMVGLAQSGVAVSFNPIHILASKIASPGSGIGHWSHLHAAFRRRGRYTKLDLIEVGARATADQQVSRMRRAWLTHMSKLENKLPASTNDEVAKEHVKMRLRQLLLGITDYKSKLYEHWEGWLSDWASKADSDPVWEKGIERWGQGSGYVEDIAALFRGAATEIAPQRTPMEIPTLAESALPAYTPLFRLDEVALTNYRCVEAAHHTLQPTTVFVANNGGGKTTWLEAIAAGLGAILTGIAPTEVPPLASSHVRRTLRRFGDVPDVQSYYPLSIRLQGQIQGFSQEWERTVSVGGIETTGETDGIRLIAAKVAVEIREGASRPLPVLAYYGTHRLWPRDIQPAPREVGNRQEGYQNCLNAAPSPAQLLAWVRDFTLSALQTGRPNPQLAAMEGAVVSCVEGCTRFYYDVAAKELYLEFEGARLTPFSALSDGYRNIVALAADIAWRASVLNPELGALAPEYAEGVVLIDEIDLHLHPIWQRRVVTDLRRTFPLIQFILTTHSPFVIQSLPPGALINLDPDATDAPYTDRSPEDIVEEVQGVDLPQRSERLRKMLEVAEQYYRLLDQIPEAKPEDLARLRTQLDGLEAPFSNDMAFVASLRVERKAAELGIR